MRAPGTRLSAAMIVRDEEAFLPNCLQSIHATVDEIVVVDTGSRDATKAVARRFGARVFDFAWRDDFAARRNHAIDQATGDWILYIDADERLRPIDPAYLRGMLSDTSKVGYQMRFFPATGFTEASRAITAFKKLPDTLRRLRNVEAKLEKVMRKLDDDGA